MAKKLYKGYGTSSHPTNSSISTTNSSSTSASAGTGDGPSGSSTAGHEGGLPSILTDGSPLPRLIVFDLDYTLWPFWVDTHVVPPVKPVPGGIGNGGTRQHCSAVTDKIGDTFSFHVDVPRMLYALPRAGVPLAIASRTHAPDLAREMLKILQVPPHPAHGHGGGGGSSREKPRRALDFFDGGLEIYPSTKIRHFEAIQKRTGVAYSEMLFFDDEARNRDVEQTLGVLFCHVKDGMTWEELEKGVKEWRRRRWDGPGVR